MRLDWVCVFIRPIIGCSSRMIHHLLILIKYYCISCSVESNKSQSKKSLTEMPSPSHSFLMETTPGFWLFSFSILYTVEGVTPERVASAFTAIFFSSHNCIIRFATASLVCNGIPPCAIYRSYIFYTVWKNYVYDISHNYAIYGIITIYRIKEHSVWYFSSSQVSVPAVKFT